MAEASLSGDEGGVQVIVEAELEGNVELAV